MRLIDADKLKELYGPYKGLNVPCAVVVQNIDDQPTVKLEYETGKWMGSVCSCCGESVSEWYNFKFCPMCGAKMEDYDE